MCWPWPKVGLESEEDIASIVWLKSSPSGSASSEVSTHIFSSLFLLAALGLSLMLPLVQIPVPSSCWCPCHHWVNQNQTHSQVPDPSQTMIVLQRSQCCVQSRFDGSPSDPLPLRLFVGLPCIQRNEIVLIVESGDPVPFDEGIPIKDVQIRDRWCFHSFHSGTKVIKKKMGLWRDLFSVSIEDKCHTGCMKWGVSNKLSLSTARFPLRQFLTILKWPPQSCMNQHRSGQITYYLDALISHSVLVFGTYTREFYCLSGTSMPTCVSPSQFSVRELAWANAALNDSGLSMGIAQSETSAPFYPSGQFWRPPNSFGPPAMCSSVKWVSFHFPVPWWPPHFPHHFKSFPPNFFSYRRGFLLIGWSLEVGPVVRAMCFCFKRGQFVRLCPFCPHS